MTDNRKILHNLAKASNRENAIKQGFYDGRFANKAIPSKKLYKRKNVYLIVDNTHLRLYEAVMEAHESFEAAMNSKFWEDHGLTPDEHGWTSDYFIHDCPVNQDLRPQTSPVPGEHDFWGPRIRTLGAHIEDEFPGLGYVVLLMPFNQLGNVSYISNARREDVVSMMRDTVRQFEEGLDKPVVGDFLKSDEELIEEWKTEFFEKYGDDPIFENDYFGSIAKGFFIAKGCTPERAEQLCLLT